FGAFRSHESVNERFISLLDSSISILSRDERFHSIYFTHFKPSAFDARNVWHGLPGMNSVAFNFMSGEIAYWFVSVPTYATLNNGPDIRQLSSRRDRRDCLLQCCFCGNNHGVIRWLERESYRSVSYVSIQFYTEINLHE